MVVSRTASFLVGLSLAGLASLAALGDGPPRVVTTEEMERARICFPGFSATIRPSEFATKAIKRSMLRARGIPQSDIGKYELDHIIPLELDGAPLDPSNLQLQLWPVAHAKDKLENQARVDYCAGTLTLEQARGMFSRDPE